MTLPADPETEVIHRYNLQDRNFHRSGAGAARRCNGLYASRVPLLFLHGWLNPGPLAKLVTSAQGQTRPRGPPPRRPYARPVLLDKRTHAGRLDRDSLGPGADSPP